jgi:4-hydroxybenzoate polyprenyltransferase
MVPLTMYLLRYGIIKPALDYGYSFVVGERIYLQFPDNLFLIVVIINMLLGAAGYVINDYFDRKIDAINKPDELIIGKTVDRRFAIILHWLLNGLATVLAAYLAWKLKKPVVLLIYMMIAGVFWLYSTTYKKQFLIGNIVVAMGTAMIPLQLAYFEIISLNQAYGEQLIMHGTSFRTLFYWIAAFAFFAFLTNFLREIVKDIEDFEGDRSYGCNTLPVVTGIKVTKIVAIVLIAAIIWFLSFAYYKYLDDPISKIYLLASVVIPLLVTAVLIVFAKIAKHYSIISIIIKIIMLFGILYAVVAKYIMVYNFSV